MTAGARRRLAFALLLVLPFVWTDDLSRFAFGRVAAFALAATGIGIVSGLAGQISLGHAALMAAGGFTSGGLAVHAGWPFWASFLAGVGVAIAAGVALGVPSLRLRGQYLALATLAGGFIVFQVVRQDPGGWTGGDLGIGNIPPPGGFGPLGISLLSLGLLAAGLFFAGNLAGSRAGRALRAVREIEPAAEAAGIPVYRTKLVAFLASAVLAGAGGALVAHGDGFVFAGDFDPRASLLLVLAAVVGGFSSPYGGALGAGLILAPPELAPGLLAWLEDYQLLAWGPIALVIVWRSPDGIAGLLARFRPRGPAREEPRGAERADVSPTQIALEARGITVRYGGVLALDKVNLTVRGGTIHALIGPNGSGKTTLLDAIQGFVRADSGIVAVGGANATRAAPHRVAGMGAARTFQSVSVFERMTVLENVLVGAHRALRGGALAGGLGLGSVPADVLGGAVSALADAGLDVPPDREASALSYGQRKRLELARALAAAPSLLLLDEPAAGRNEVEIIELGRLLLRLRDRGMTILLVEHHMNFVLSIADAVTVLDEGRVVAEGPPAAVRADPAVIAAYLGEDVA